MMGKRKRYSAEFKAKVALDAIRGEQTIAQLAAKHGIHQTMINAWKKQAIEGMSGVFSGKAEAAYHAPVCVDRNQPVGFLWRPSPRERREPGADEGCRPAVHGDAVVRFTADDHAAT